jgi:predicted permease
MPSFFDPLLQDIRYAVRTLRRDPGFAAVTVATLALGIGANAGIFSVVNAALLKPMAFPHPEQLVLLFERNLAQAGNLPNVVSVPNFLDWQAQARSFTSMAAARQNSFNMGSDGGGLLPERIDGAVCSWSMFPTMGVAPLMGRTFSADEDRPGARRVAVIGYGLWHRRFGGDPAILGRPIRLDSQNYDIIGVMPRGFTYPAHNVDLWLPLQAAIAASTLQNRTNHQFYVVARTRPDVPQQQAAAEIEAIAQRIKAANPGLLIGDGAMLFPLAEASTRQSRTALLVLFGAVGCLLLIACVNIANLLFARGSRRRREMAVRTAIGAARSRLVRQLLTESLLLSLTGAAIGLVLAAGLTSLLAANAPALLNANDIDTSAPIRLDSWAFLFTAVIAVMAGVATGLIPAWQASRSDITGGLREGSRSSAGGRSASRFRSSLVAVEVGVSVMLLIAAGLLIRSFGELRRVNPGVRTDHVLTAGIALPQARYQRRESASLFARQLEERLRALPGVGSVGLVTCLPVGGQCEDNLFYIEGRPLPPGQFRLALSRSATPEYFATVGIPLLNGRLFSPQEGRGFDDEHPRMSAILISDSMAKRFWPNGDALGKRIYFDTRPNAPHYQIVGVVGDVRARLEQTPRPTFYRPMAEGERTNFYAVLRTEGDPGALGAAVRREIGSLDADLPAFRVRPMDDLLDVSAAQRRYTILLLGCFAGLALLLAGVGLYGVLSYSVAQRVNEIGIRLALGARQGQVRSLVLLEGLRPALIGLLLGVAGAAAASRILRTLLFGIGPGDLATFIAAPIVLLLIALAACAAPAWRATQVDPMVALRSE